MLISKIFKSTARMHGTTVTGENVYRNVYAALQYKATQSGIAHAFAECKLIISNRPRRICTESGAVLAAVDFMRSNKP